MSPPGTDSPGAIAESWLLPAMVFFAAAFAGMVTAVVAGMVGYRAIYYVAVCGLIGVGGILAITRGDPLRFAFLALIVSFPVAYALVPPGRLGLTVFDTVMIALTIALIGKRLFAASPAGAPIFPTRSLLIAWLLCVPCVVFSQYPLLSLQIFIQYFAVYAFFLFALDELRRDGGFERLVLLLSIVSLVMAIGLFVDRVLHVNLSLRGGALNQLSYSGGLEIWRAAGFFQDPQRAGAFLASMITFLVVLAVRGRFRDGKMRLLVWGAIALGSAALLTTISRGAIVSCFLVSAMALFAFNRWNAAVKLAITGSMILAVMVLAMAPAEMWLDMVPVSVTERFLRSRAEFDIRLKIWFDTWNMFADHPITGIGFGSFRDYLIETQPTVFNYYGIGTAQGVAYVPDQPESGYLKVLYEGGIAGSLAALLVGSDAFRRAAVVIAGSNTSAGARTECIAALAGFMTFGATFITLFTVSDQRIAGVLAFLLAVIWHRSLQRAEAAPKA
jgi:O-antigen ligase